MYIPFFHIESSLDARLDLDLRLETTSLTRTDTSEHVGDVVAISFMSRTVAVNLREVAIRNEGVRHRCMAAVSSSRYTISS